MPSSRHTSSNRLQPPGLIEPDISEPLASPALIWFCGSAQAHTLAAPQPSNFGISQPKFTTALTVAPGQHIGITLVSPWAPVLQCSHSGPVAECTHQGTGDADNGCLQAPPALGRTIGLGGSPQTPGCRSQSRPLHIWGLHQTIANTGPGPQS